MVCFAFGHRYVEHGGAFLRQGRQRRCRGRSNLGYLKNGVTDSTTAATENVNTEPALNFGGKTFTLLHWDDGYPNEYFVEEQTGDLIADSVFLRNALVEERLGVEI